MYELYWLSKYFWRCSVEKTFLTSNKSDDLLLSNSSSLDFLASSLSCHNKELRNRDILNILSFIFQRYFPPWLLLPLSFPGEPCIRAVLQKLASWTLLAWHKKIINTLKDIAIVIIAQFTYFFMFFSLIWASIIFFSLYVGQLLKIHLIFVTDTQAVTVS